MTGYDVVLEPAPSPARRRVVAEVLNEGGREDRDHDAAGAVENESPTQGPREPEEDEDRPYQLNEPEVQPDERIPQEVVKPSELEMKLLSRDDTPRPPKRVWSPDLAAFLVQPGTISVVLTLSAMCFAVGGMVRIAREFNPARE